MEGAQPDEASAGTPQAAAAAVLRFKRIRRYLLIINVAVVLAVLMAIALLFLL